MTHEDIIKHLRECPICLTTAWVYLIQPNLSLKMPPRTQHATQPNDIAPQSEIGAQAKQFITYQTSEVTDGRADQAIMEMYRQEVINLQRIPDVLKEWNEPTHDWGSKTAWRLFNAATFALTGRVAENPAATATLHKIIDGTCERLQ